MKMILRFITLWLIGIIITFGNFYWAKIKYSQPVGISSYENDYRLVTLTDSNDLVHTVMVVFSESELDIQYSIPNFFPASRSFYACWANESNDFFVCSGDIGTFLYMYDNEKSTWEEYSFTKEMNGNEENYFVEKIIPSYGGTILYGPKQPYPAFNIPDKVLGYIRT